MTRQIEYLGDGARYKKPPMLLVGGRGVANLGVLVRTRVTPTVFFKSHCHIHVGSMTVTSTRGGKLSLKVALRRGTTL